MQSTLPLYLMVASISSNSGLCRMPMPNLVVLLQPTYVPAEPILAVEGLNAVT